MHRLSPLLSLLLVATGLSLASCSSEIDDKPAATVQEAPAPQPAASESAAPSADATTLALDPASSKLEFVGAKVTGDHRGTFKDYAGSLVLNPDGSVSRLDVEVQLGSLAIEPERLLGHLKSPDFFDVANFPTAKFSLTRFTEQASADATHLVAGELELHGVRKQIEFPAKVSFQEADVAASALFTINRKDFGIVYPGKPDDLIKDDVLLDIAFRFPRPVGPGAKAAWRHPLFARLRLAAR
jgi:polyisoprenoid-binding protein YceI